MHNFLDSLLLSLASKLFCWAADRAWKKFGPSLQFPAVPMTANEVNGKLEFRLPRVCLCCKDEVLEVSRYHLCKWCHEGILERIFKK